MAGGAINVFVKRHRAAGDARRGRRRGGGAGRAARRGGRRRGAGGPVRRARRPEPRSWPTSAASPRPSRASPRAGAGEPALSRAARTSNLPARMPIARLRPDLGRPRARPALDRPQRRPERCAQRLQSQSRGEPQGGDRVLRGRAASCWRGRAVRGHQLRRGARRHPGGQREQPHGGRAARARAVRAAAARSATRSRPPTPSPRSARTSTRCARRRSSCSTRSRTAAPAGNGPDGGRPLEGEDAEDVAAYVAKAVGQTGQGQ